MKNDKNIENMLRSAVSHAAPDARDAILSACDNEKGKVIYMEKKRSSPLRGFAAVAAGVSHVVEVAVFEHGAYDRVYRDLKGAAFKLHISEHPPSVVVETALIRQIIAADSRHSFEELAPLSINELNLIADGKTLSGIASDGAAASSKAYIGRDAAVDAALGHAGVTRSEVRKLDVDLDYEHGSMVYEVEFKVGTAEYEYDIGAADGDIIWYEIERDGIVEQGGSAIDGKAAISADDAKTAALNHAGLTASQVTHLKAELDREGGKLVYEVEFKSGGHEYEYVIDAATGAVIKSEKEHD